MNHAISYTWEVQAHKIWGGAPVCPMQSSVRVVTPSPAVDTVVFYC